MSSSRPRDECLACFFVSGVLVEVQGELDDLLPLPPHGGPEANLIHAVLSDVQLRDHGQDEPVVGFLAHSRVPLVQGQAGGPQMTGLNPEAPGMDARQCPDECKMLPVFLTRGAEERAGSAGS
nr:hypothetical protein [uncultured Cohaesibacter sp.]